MTKPRGRDHTTLTETAKEVVEVLRLIPGIKMIAPGIISQGGKNRSGKRFVSIVHTRSGLELIITGQGVQKVAVHAQKEDIQGIIEALKSSKRLKLYAFKERERKPGV